MLKLGQGGQPCQAGAGDRLFLETGFSEHQSLEGCQPGKVDGRSVDDQRAVFQVEGFQLAESCQAGN